MCSTFIKVVLVIIAIIIFFVLGVLGLMRSSAGSVIANTLKDRELTMVTTCSHGESFPSPPVKYCAECGKELILVVKQEQNIRDEYDIHTGNMKHYFKISATHRCPDNKHWWDEHTRAYIIYDNSTGNWYNTSRARLLVRQ